MNGYYIFLIFIVSLFVAFFARVLALSGMQNTTHAIELVLIVLAVILFLCDSVPYYVLFMFTFVMWRELIRVINDCYLAAKNNKEK